MSLRLTRAPASLRCATICSTEPRIDSPAPAGASSSTRVTTRWEADVAPSVVSSATTMMSAGNSESSAKNVKAAA